MVYGDGWADPLGELALTGRTAETEVIDRLLGDARSGRSGVLVLTGEAGVGKSALLAYARARADGMRVLQTAGVQSEAEIEFAALYQLLRPALDGVGSLPSPQAAALGAALIVDRQVALPIAWPDSGGMTVNMQAEDIFRIAALPPAELRALAETVSGALMPDPQVSATPLGIYRLLSVAVRAGYSPVRDRFSPA